MALVRTQFDSAVVLPGREHKNYLRLKFKLIDDPEIAIHQQFVFINIGTIGECKKYGIDYNIIYSDANVDELMRKHFGYEIYNLDLTYEKYMGTFVPRVINITNIFQ